jgi:hypothetical protein
VSDRPQEKRPSLLSWAAVAGGLVLGLTESLEPWLFEGQEYNLWRVVKIVGWLSFVAVMAFELRKDAKGA